MPPDKRSYVNVDELLPRISLEQVAAFYGVTLPAITQVGDEIRLRCFLNCGKTAETGDRALSFQVSHPAKQWKCHQYGCPQGGNLISVCDLLKPGASAGGRPRGDRFKEIATDLQAMLQRVLATPQPAVPQASSEAIADKSEKSEPTVNIPLRLSPNERARSLVSLDDKFLIEPGSMTPFASAYFRKRPFLTPDLCCKWRMGYLPRDAGSDRTGGTMRGMIVYPLLSERGDILTWFGRDPQHEHKKLEWERGDKLGREPEKFHFVKGFHRGLELFGQQASRLSEPGYREKLHDLSVIIVEGPNDVIALDSLGIPAVGLMSNIITDDQVMKITRWAELVGNHRVTLLLDCDAPGETGMKEALWKLSQHCDVRLGWSESMYGGHFKGRQPESLTIQDWQIIERFLRSRDVGDQEPI
ncbi:MAG: primase [Planctomycetaceae bacterium]|nr:primase [Planctomycetaceae bacterium]